MTHNRFFDAFFFPLAESCQDCVCFFDRNRRLVFINQAGLRLLGLDRAEDARELRLDDIFAPEDRPRIAALLGGDAFGSVEADLRLRRIDGAGTPARLRIVESVDAQGQAAGYAVIARDVSESRKSDMALRESEEFNRAIIHNSPDCVKVLDREGRIVMINEPGCRLMEIDDPSVCEGKAWAELWPEHQRKQVLQSVARALAGESVRFEAFRPTAKGTPKWWDVIVTPLRDGCGGVQRLLAVSRDVSENKRNVEELIRSRRDLDRAQEVGQMGWWRLDLQSNRLTWSDENYRIFGLPLGQPLTYQSFLDVVHPEDRAYLQTRWQAALSGAPYDLEHRIVVGGRIKWVREKAYLETDSSGALRGGFGVTQDISERKRAEVALRRSEERFRAIFEHAGTGIAITDWSGRLVQCNPAYCRLLGYGEDELKQIVFSELVHPEDREENLAAIARLRREELPFFEIENRYVRKDGETVWVRKFVSLLHDEGGTPAHLFALVTDVTERRRMEEALRLADRRKDEFIATLAHELRNPLAPILNAVTVLKRRVGQGPTDELHAMIERQVRHLVRLVDELLEVSRISSGKIELKKERVDLAEVIGHAIETSQPAVKAQRHALTVALPDAPLVVEGDSVRLAQIFANLITNAAKYTEPGGRIRIGGVSRSGEAVITVEDSGVGIPAEMLPRVFDLFTQVDRSLGRAQGGLGIGLALVRRLVELHGGQVEADSPGPGCGSVFTVRLPLAGAARRGHAAGAKETAGRHLPTARVLVVDDNRDAADSLVILLNALGAQTCVAYDGPGGIAACGAFAPDIVLLDLGMPEMDGFETAQRIRALYRERPPMLVALTGWGQTRDRRRTAAAGFDAHLTKPAGIEALEALLATRAAAAQKGGDETAATPSRPRFQMPAEK